MASIKPVFVFVPGAWHDPEVFDATSSLLTKEGYSYKYVNLPSVGSKIPLQDITVDVEIIKGIVEGLLEARTDVAIVMHSYGGVPTSEAMKYFMNDNRDKNGRGKIVRMIWICSFVLPQGCSIMAMLDGKPMPWQKVKDGKVSVIDPKTIFYNDISDAEAEPWIKDLQHHSHGTFHSTVSVEPWTIIPSAYLVCERDNAIPVHAQDHMIAMAQSKAATAFDLVERCDASHSPFLSMPGTVANFLIKAVDGL